MKPSQSLALPSSHDVQSKPESDWTSPMHLDDFRQKYFFRVYGFLCAQFATIFGVCFLFSQTDTLKKSLDKKQILCYVFIVLSLIAYGALYVKKFNNPEKTMAAGLMQILFTIILAFTLAFVDPTLKWNSFIWASALICISCLIILIAYRYFAFEFHTFQGTKFIFRGVLCTTVGLFMLIFVDKMDKDPQENLVYVIQGQLDGFIIASVVLVYFAWSTRRMVNSTVFIRYKMDNFIFGATLIYTAPALNFFYKSKSN